MTTLVGEAAAVFLEAVVSVVGVLLFNGFSNRSRSRSSCSNNTNGSSSSGDKIISGILSKITSFGR